MCRVERRVDGPTARQEYAEIGGLEKKEKEKGKPQAQRVGVVRNVARSEINGSLSRVGLTSHEWV